jgi:hypothetical protein
MPDPGFMIPLNLDDFLFPLDGGSRDICSSANQQTYTKAPWWTCENIQLTVGGTPTSSAVVGTSYVIQVGIEGLPAQGGDTTPAMIQNVEAWVCYPNTVAGGTSATLVVPSMQNSNFASFSNTTAGPLVFFDDITGDYQNPKEGGFALINLSPWTPSEEDFLEQSDSGGHCCIIANAAGQASLLDVSDPNSGQPVGVVITNNSQLSADIDVCHSLYQGQRNIVIVPARTGMIVRGGDQIKTGLAFLSGAPEQTTHLETTVAVTAIDQGGKLDPVLLKALSGSPYAGLPLKAAASPPKSLSLAKHKLRPHSWFAEIIHEAEEIVEDVLGLEKHPFGGGHQLHLRLPPRGLQPLRMAVEPDRNEQPGTVHAIEITQTDANGARGGILVAVVITP